MDEFPRTYSEFSADNLTLHKVIHFPEKPYVLVNTAHPVMEMLRVNNDTLELKLDEKQRFDRDNAPNVDGQWFRVSTQILEACCDTLKKRFFNAIPVSCQNSVNSKPMADISTFSTQIINTRIGELKAQVISNQQEIDSCTSDLKRLQMQTNSFEQRKKNHEFAIVQIYWELERLNKELSTRQEAPEQSTI